MDTWLRKYESNTQEIASFADWLRDEAMALSHSLYLKCLRTFPVAQRKQRLGDWLWKAALEDDRATVERVLNSDISSTTAERHNVLAAIYAGVEQREAVGTDREVSCRLWKCIRKYVSPERFFTAYKQLIDRGNLDQVRWAAEAYEQRKFNCKRAAFSTHAVYDVTNASERGPICRAALHGHLDVLRWIVEKGDSDGLSFSMLTDGSATCCAAASGGHLHILKWLKSDHSKRRRSLTSFWGNWAMFAFDKAGRSGSIELLEWLKQEAASGGVRARELFFWSSPRQIRNARLAGHTHVVDWVRQCERSL